MAARKIVYGTLAQQERHTMLMHTGPAYAGIHTGTHFQHIAGDFVIPNILQRLDAAIEAVHRNRFVILPLSSGIVFRIPPGTG